MAVKALTPVKGKLNDVVEFAFAAATSTTDGFEFVLPGQDERVSILVTNTSADTAYDITLKAPADGTIGASTTDEVHELAAGECAIIKYESAKWMDKDDQKIVLVPENAAVEVAIVYGL